MAQSTEDKRTMLQNMLAGGDGHLTDWIEKAIYEATDTAPEMDVYIYHIPGRKYQNGYTSKGSTFVGSMKQCKMFYTMMHDEELPDRMRSQEEIDAFKAAIPFTDTGRRIPKEKQQTYGSIVY